MRLRHPTLNAAVVAVALAFSAGISCYHHYDNDDHHHWSDAERPYYQRWEQETHRDHKDWDQRNGDEQKAYWQWRVTISG